MLLMGAFLAFVEGGGRIYKNTPIYWDPWWSETLRWVTCSLIKLYAERLAERAGRRG